jgi:F-type H+-transporting ATPase subunit delta
MDWSPISRATCRPTNSMTISALGNRYAQALADVVTAAGATVRADAAVLQLRSFEALLAGSVELQNALTSPAVPPARKRAVVTQLGARLGLAQVSRNFLFVLIDHRRIGQLTEILHKFELIVDERLGFARAEVTSARALTDAQQAALSRQLGRVTGKQVRIRATVDESLIGGVVARIGSTVYDGSVRGQLAALGKRLGAKG